MKLRKILYNLLGKRQNDGFKFVRKLNDHCLPHSTFSTSPARLTPAGPTCPSHHRDARHPHQCRAQITPVLQTGSTSSPENQLRCRITHDKNLRSLVSSPAGFSTLHTWPPARHFP